MINTYLGTWDQIDKMHETIFSPEWRQKMSDSEGNPYVLSWHYLFYLAALLIMLQR